MNTPNFIENIDWSELRQQKTQLLDTITWLSNFPANNIAKDLDGILHLIDHLQDYAVDELGINENHIFDFEKEEEREKETPQELFAREMADTIYDTAVEYESIYCDMPEGMTIEFVDEVLNNQYNIDIMKGDMRAAILEDVLEHPEDFNTEEIDSNDGTIKVLCYDYTLIEKYGGTIDHFIENEYNKTRTKTLKLCPHCYSDNVQIRQWHNANTGKYIQDDNSCSCMDCDLDCEELLEVEMPYLREVIGFQVFNKDGNVHPRLISDKHICRLSQANEIIEGTLNKDGMPTYKLVTVWSGVMNEPEPIFGGDPRS